MSGRSSTIVMVKDRVKVVLILLSLFVQFPDPWTETVCGLVQVPEEVSESTPRVVVSCSPGPEQPWGPR